MNLMKYILTITLLFLLAVLGVQALEVPGDLNGDKVVSVEEVAAAEKLVQEGKLSADEVEEIKHIHKKYPISITDSENRTITIYKPIEKTIILHTTGYEPLLVLGAQNKLAAVTSTAKELYSYVPGMSNKTTIGAYNEIDYEKVIESKPDIVLAYRCKPEVEEKLKLADIPIFVLKFSETDKFDKEFRILADLLEKEDRADEFISWRNDYLYQITTQTKAIDPKIKVFIATGNGPWGSSTNGSNSHDTVTAAGGYNIASEISGEYGGVTVDPEWVIKMNPEIVIAEAWVEGEPPSNLTGYNMKSPDNAKQYLETLYRNEVLKETSAGKNGRIYIFHGPILLGSCSSPIGICYCAKWFYPEVFKDLNPDDINKEYFEKWLGAPYKGVWGYPTDS